MTLGSRRKGTSSMKVPSGPPLKISHYGDATSRLSRIYGHDEHLKESSLFVVADPGTWGSL